jgi:hypothetical protein
MSRRAPPDGYTMLLGFNGPLAFGPLLQKLPYDVARDLAPVIILSSQPNVLAVNAQLPVRNLRELVAWAKGESRQAQHASVGNGSSSHLNMEMLKSVAGFDAVHVPFNGSPPAVTATIQNETQMMFAVMQPLQPQIEAGKLRAIAVTTASAFLFFPISRRSPNPVTRLRSARVERRDGARRHAEGDRRPPQRRNESDIEATRRRRENARVGIRPDRRHARGLRRSDPARS